MIPDKSRFKRPVKHYHVVSYADGLSVFSFTTEDKARIWMLETPSCRNGYTVQQCWGVDGETRANVPNCDIPARVEDTPTLETQWEDGAAWERSFIVDEIEKWAKDEAKTLSIPDAIYTAKIIANFVRYLQHPQY